MERLLEQLGRITASHPWRTISVWLVTTVALMMLAMAGGGAFINDFGVPGASSQRATDLARDEFPDFGATSADVVWHATEGTLTEPARAAAIQATLAAFRTQPGVIEASDPVSTTGAGATGGLLSEDQRTAISSVRYDRELSDLGPEVYHQLNDAAEAARAQGVTVDFRGVVIELAFEPATGVAEGIGLLAALVVLLIAFGSVIAAGLPILMALAGLIAGTALILITAALVDIPTSAPIVAVMLGIGAGIDYALLVVTRFRRFLADGLSPVDAAARAVATAGHAVLFAGATVVVAILGLLFTGIPFVGAMGIAGALTVSVMMAAALTLLPAVLGLLGRRVDRWRIGRAARPSAGPVTGHADATDGPRHRADNGKLPSTPGGPADTTGRWTRWGRQVDARRVLYTVAASLLLLVISAPVLALKLGTPDEGNQPLDWTMRRAYDTVAAEFGPGWNAPLLVVVQQSAGEPLQTANLGQLAERVSADPEVTVVSPPTLSPDGRTALVTVVPRHAPQDEEVADLVHRLREDLAPVASAWGGELLVGGQTAYMIDLSDTVAVRLPWVVAAVILAACLLLLAMFRAPLIAVKAAVMALLSIGVAYGLLVAVFQWGWGLSLLGMDQPVPIISVVPMLLFAILFGLSMDYEVFLLSAVREAYDAGASPREAVIDGLATTGRVITAAATIMAVVFLSFIWINDPMVKMIALGLTAAVIVDATVIRMMLAPALMSLLGHRAWWPRSRGWRAGTPRGSRSAAVEATAEAVGAHRS